MKTIGILGGMSWHSTQLYYQMINEGIQKRLGGLNSAKILLSSVNFAEIAQLQNADNWDQAGQRLSEQAQKLQQAGADCILIATNTMHILVPVIEQHINIPILHIADATADSLTREGYKTTGLLGTRFTMQMDYYRDRLIDRGLQVIVPEPDDCQRVDDVIFKELCYGTIKDSSRAEYIAIINNLQYKGESV